MTGFRPQNGGGGLLGAALGFAEPWWDDEAGLLWNMDGAFTDLCPPRTVHLIPPSAWFALGLLVRDGPGDRARAEATLFGLLAHQYDEPGAPWHGTFARFAEWPRPEAGAVMWEGYDPNWRQFVGTAFALVLDEAEDRLDPGLAAALERSIALCVEGEPDGRVTPAYSNIALMKAWLDGWAGQRAGDPGLSAAGDRLAHEVAERFARAGAFDEYLSPTYYGVDLLGLALWRERGTSARMRELGAQLESALWRDLAQFFHAGLGNLCGPWDRAYGADMTSYLGAVGLWWWPALGEGAAPVPDLTQPFEHSHDTLLGVPAAVLGPAIPDDAAGPLQRFPGEHLVRREIGRRTITAWLAEDVMLGGQAGSPAAADDQFHPATGHWRLPGGGVGWFRIRADGAVSATASEGALSITCDGAATSPVLELGLEVEDAAGLMGTTLALPGLDLDLRSRDGTGGVAVGAGRTLIRFASIEGVPVQIDLQVAAAG